MSESWEPNSSASISSAGAIPARRIAEPASRAARGRRLLALNSSAWLRRVAQGLFSERIRHASAQMRLGLGGDSDRSSNVWDTWCCPSDSEPVALARTTSGIGCSCLARMPTPTASVFGCADVPRMLARRQPVQGVAWERQRLRADVFAMGGGEVVDADRERLARIDGEGVSPEHAGRAARGGGWAPRREDGIPAPRVCGSRHGIPHYVDRIRGLGNAVYPAAAEWIGRQILEADAALRATPQIPRVEGER